MSCVPCLQGVLNNTTLPFSPLFLHCQTKPYSFPWELAFISISFYSPLQAPQDSVPASQTNTSESPLSLDRQQHAFLSVSTSGVATEVHGLGFSLIVSVRPEGRGNGCWHKRGVTGYSREATTEAAATTAEALTGRVPVKQKKGSKRLRSSPQPLKLARGFVVKEGRGGEQETAKREDGATRVNSGKRGNNSLLVCAFCQMMVGCCGVLLLPRELHPCFQLLPVL